MLSGRALGGSWVRFGLDFEGFGLGLRSILGTRISVFSVSEPPSLKLLKIVYNSIR